MRSRLRALERTLVYERAIVVVEPLADTFIDAWIDATDGFAPYPDELELIHAIVKRGIPILTMTPLTCYLEQCRVDGRIPNVNRVTETIVNGHHEMSVFIR